MLDFRDPLGLALALIPALANIVLLAFVLVRLPRDRTVNTLALLVASLVAWCLADASARAATTADAARSWWAVLAAAQLLVFPAALHFAALFAGRGRWFRHPAAVAALYLPALVFEGLLLGFGDEPIVRTAVFGWVPSMDDPGPLMRMQNAWGALLAVAAVAVLFLAVTEARSRDRRRAAVLLTGGLAIFVGTHLFTEVVVPQFMARPPARLASTASVFFVGAVAIAIGRNGLFKRSIDAARRGVLDSMGEMVVVATRDGAVLYANREASRIWGIEASSPGVHRVRDLFPDDTSHLSFVNDPWQRALEGRRVLGYATRVVSETVPIPVLLSTSRIDVGGELGVVIVAHDATALRAAAVQGDYERQTLANISYQLRTQLSTIIGYTEMMMEALDVDEIDDVRNDLPKVHGAATTLLGSVNRYLIRRK